MATLSKRCFGIFFAIFSMSLIAQAVSNNSCENAKWIEISEQETILVSDSYTNVETYSSCSGNSTYENGAISYYRFVVPPNGRIRFNNKANSLVEYSIKIFNNCGGEVLFCDDVSTYYPGILTPIHASFINVEEFESGTTLIMELSENADNLYEAAETIVLELPFLSNAESNNICANPKWIDLKPNGEIAKIKINHSGNSLSKTPSCYRGYDYLTDSYFNIIVPPSGILRFSYTKAYGINVIEKCNYESSYCFSRNFAGGNIDVDYLEPGDTLLVQFFQDNIALEDLSVQELIVPQNSYCDNAQFIENENSLFNPYNYQLDLMPSCGWIDISADGFYKLIVPASGAIKLNMVDETNQLNFCGLAIYNNCTSDPLHCVPPRTYYNGDFYPYINQVIGKAYGPFVVSELNPDDTLILQLFLKHKTGLYNPSYEVVQPTSNNICNNATTINLNQAGGCSELISFSLTENNLDMMPECYRLNNIHWSDVKPYADIFYKMTVPSNGAVQFYFQELIGLAIYDGCNGKSLFCDTKTEGDLHISNLAPDSEIIIQMYNFWHMDNTFSFCVENQNLYCHLDDWTALKALYESTNGDEWFIQDGWEVVRYNAPPENCDLSTLFGVGLNADGRVNCIDLDIEYNCSFSEQSWGNDLTGILPDEIGLLSELTDLCLNDNQIGGVLPESLGQLSQLKSLRLHGNKFSGEIPENIFGNLKNLEVAFLSANQLSGSIPESIGACINLRELGLFQNQLTGEISESLANLSNLQTLNLRNNKLSGSIPNQLSKISTLKTLYLSSNNLNGCYHEDLSVLCNQLNKSNLNKHISFGNYFDAEWEDFCICNASSCNEAYTTIVVNDLEPSQAIYKANGEIKTEGTVHIKNGKDVMFSAKNIFLNNGFEVDKTSDFTASYEPCIDANVLKKNQ